MNISLSEINNEILHNAGSFIRKANESYLSRLTEIAADIADNRTQKPVILLSGPSGSGKTTTALMIEQLLDSQGISTHTFSMDNYFRPLTDSEKQLLSEGKVDLESPARVDSELLTHQLEAIIACEPVDLIRYDFRNSTRSVTGTFRRAPGELVILEGIHALNPQVISLPDERTAKIYVSVRTRITSGDIVLHPSKIRLMRRLVRDMKFRQRSFAETVRMFRSVEEGENKYIMPFKYRSTYDVDTFMPYEVGAYKNFLLDGLTALNRPELSDAVQVLSEAAELDWKKVTPDSLICEFIGNGQFIY